MKNFTLIASFLFITVAGFTQSNGKINLIKGQKFLLESKSNATISQEAMGQTMDINVDFNSANTIEVKDVKDTTYKIINTTTKLKMNTNLMGQETSYDSEKKEDQESETGKSVGKMINNPKEIEINKAGKIVGEIKAENKSSDNNSDMISGMMQNMMGGVDDGTQGLNLAFHAIPSNIAAGYVWGDSTNTDGSITHTNYTVKEVKGDEAIVEVKGDMQISKKTEAQGMELSTTSKGTFTGEEIININTGIIKQKNTILETKGTVEAVGQQFPVSTKVTSSSTVKSIQ